MTLAFQLFALSGLAILASASPAAVQSCNSGAIQCCQQLATSGSGLVSTILGAVGAIVDGLNLPIGIVCTPVSGVGVGSGDACSAVTVCCENDSIGGLISIGCIPIVL
ncbi:fungal hydrophobin-domain-containing protein [Trametes polyzona]|nr:fungal hydrophobin-domain-containing protein [Trametes polyzona]